jgi:hypothetical protein
MKKWTDDPTKSWEERFKALEAHHIEETQELINKYDRLNGQIKGRYEKPPTVGDFDKEHVWWAAPANQRGFADWVGAVNEENALQVAKALAADGSHPSVVIRQKREGDDSFRQVYIVRCRHVAVWDVTQDSTLLSIRRSS